MHQPRSQSHSLFLSIAALCLTAVAVTSVAVPVAMRASPPAPVIATVDLEQVLSKLNERTESNASLEAYFKRLQADLDQLGKDLAEQENKLAVLSGPEQAAARKDAAATLIQARANAKVKKEVYEALIDQQRGESLKKLYEKITAAAKSLAQQNKYTMVIVSDESVRVPDGPSQDIGRTISLKRLLYVDTAHDITADVVTLMNNEFKAGVAPAAVPGGAPATKQP